VATGWLTFFRSLDESAAALELTLYRGGGRMTKNLGHQNRRDAYLVVLVAMIAFAAGAAIAFVTAHREESVWLGLVFVALVLYFRTGFWFSRRTLRRNLPQDQQNDPK